MKKLLMMMALLPLMAAADTEVVDGITWTYTITDGESTIKDYMFPMVVAVYATIVCNGNSGCGNDCCGRKDERGEAQGDAV